MIRKEHDVNSRELGPSGQTGDHRLRCNATTASGGCIVEMKRNEVTSRQKKCW
jgi:hypothetical protein